MCAYRQAYVWCNSGSNLRTTFCPNVASNCAVRITASRTVKCNCFTTIIVCICNALVSSCICNWILISTWAGRSCFIWSVRCASCTTIIQWANHINIFSTFGSCVICKRFNIWTYILQIDICSSGYFTSNTETIFTGAIIRPVKNNSATIRSCCR